MILENDLIRITLDSAHGAALRGLLDKANGVEFAAVNSVKRRESDLAALFCDRAFEAGTPHSDDANLAVTLSALSADGSLKLTKTFSIKKNERGFAWTVKAENLSATDRDVLWGETVGFGGTFITATTRINAPVVSYFDPKEEPVLRMRWPKLADGTDLSLARCAQPGAAKTFFLTDFAAGTCGIESPACNLVLELSWDASVFSYCWLEEGFETLALAPHTGMPNALEEGHGTISIPAGGSVSVRINVAIAPLS